jgi:hypothetical protein
MISDGGYVRGSQCVLPDERPVARRLRLEKLRSARNAVENYRLKAGRILRRLKVASRLKPSEGARLQSRLKAWRSL